MKALSETRRATGHIRSCEVHVTSFPQATQSLRECLILIVVTPDDISHGNESSVRRIIMFEISALCVAAFVQVSAGLYYESRPLVCPLKQDVLYDDKAIQATYLEVLREPLVATHVHLKTVYQTTTLPVTATHIHTVTAPLPSATVTEVELVETQVPLTVTQVEAVTRRLTETDLDVATRTPTN